MTEMRRVPVDDKKSRPVMPTFGSGPPPDPITPEPAEEECDCPRLDAADWHEVESDWSDISFVKGSTTAVLGVPIGYGELRKELAERAAKLGATVPVDAMVLMGSGRFRRPVMLEVEDAGAGVKGVERPGGFVFTRLIPAPWGEMRHVLDATVDAANDRYGRKPDDTWLWYLTCRICSQPRNFEVLVLAHYREKR
ncbi:hypothetical protein AYO38_11105 [bacterium SCGC AG-212-C10]|nr:hypothetical protein AYO38_11105 [bacterium SCGC AG-212-C10]